MGETATIETAELTEAQQAEASQGFAEGFSENQPTGSTPPAELTESHPAEPANEPEPAPAQPAPKYVQITEEQFAALNEAATKVPALAATLEKMSGTAFGKIGGLERTLKELQAATPSGQAVEVSEDDFEEMKADFPELAKMQAAGINRAMKKIGLKGTAVPAFDETKFTELVDGKVASKTQELEQGFSKRLMNVMDRSYRQEAPSDYKGWWATIHLDSPDSKPYHDWLATQPTEYQQKILNTWEMEDLFDSIKQFHQSTAGPKRKPADPPVDPGEARRRRLQQGVQPRSEGAASSGEPSETDGFRAGFKENYRAV